MAPAGHAKACSTHDAPEGALNMSTFRAVGIRWHHLIGDRSRKHDAQSSLSPL